MGSMKDALGDDPPAWTSGDSPHWAKSSYPTSPGYKAPGTSKEAAKAMASTADDLRARALAHIRQKPSTADETAEALGASVLAIRPRISELRKQSLVQELLGMNSKPIRRKNASGQSATVWEAVPTRPEQKTLPL